MTSDPSPTILHHGTTLRRAKEIEAAGADPIAAGLARSGEIPFDPESGLNELRAEWPKLVKRVIPL